MPPKAKGTYRLSMTAQGIIEKYGNLSVTATLVHLDNELQKVSAIAQAKEMEATRLTEILMNFNIRAKENKEGP